MIPAVVAADGSGFTTGPYSSGTDQQAFFVFCPTFRIPFVPGTGGNLSNISQREASYTFAKGIKENCRLYVSGPGGVLWRRLVISFHSDPQAGPIGGWAPKWTTAKNSTTGYARALYNQLAGSNFPSIQSNLWRGFGGVDWTDDFTAKPDTQLVKVHYDRTMSFNPGAGTTASSTIYSKSFYHPLNKMMLYADDEQANTGNTAGFVGRGGLGDVYIVDLFRKSNLSDSTTTWQFSPECTYYWHER